MTGEPFVKDYRNAAALAPQRDESGAQMETLPSGPNNCVRRVVNVPSACMEGICGTGGSTGAVAAGAPAFPLAVPVPVAGGYDGTVDELGIGIGRGRPGGKV